ncbi:MAG: hypothetical protein QME58_12455 [Bacteroidota bacterium]|nr:hypothetical protein [Bacteroidota bacterium]
MEQSKFDRISEWIIQILVIICVLYIGCNPSLQETITIIEKTDTIRIISEPIIIDTQSGQLEILRDSIDRILDIKASLDTAISNAHMKIKYQLSQNRWDVHILRGDTVLVLKYLDTVKTKTIDKIIYKTPPWVYLFIVVVVLGIFLIIIIKIKP